MILSEHLDSYGMPISLLKRHLILNESQLMDYAEREMRLAGLYDDDSDYGGMIPDAVLSMIKAHSDQGHSGGSHALVMDIFNKVVNYKPLTPLTSNPEEWMEVTDMTADGKPLHQSKRSPSVFSQDGGNTWYDIDDPEKKNWPPEKLGTAESTSSKNFPLLEGGGEGSIFTLILFQGCDLPEILHCSHFATGELDKYDEIVKVCDDYFKDSVDSRELEFNEPGTLGKEEQAVLKLTDGDPYKYLFDELSKVAKYKYSEFKPHVSVTSNVDAFTGTTSCLVISKNGTEMKRYPFNGIAEAVYNEHGIPLVEKLHGEFSNQLECGKDIAWKKDQQNQFLMGLKQTSKMPSDSLVNESTSELSKVLWILYLDHQERRKFLQSLNQFQTSDEVKKQYTDWCVEPFLPSKVEWFLGSRQSREDGGFEVNVRVKIQSGFQEDPIRAIFEMIYWEGQPTGFLYFKEIGYKDEMQKKYQLSEQDSSSDLFNLWLGARDKLQSAVDVAENNLKKITGDNKGKLTPDSIKSTEEYKQAKINFDKAFKNLRDFSSKSPKEFMRRASKIHGRDDEPVEEGAAGDWKKEGIKFIHSSKKEVFRGKETGMIDHTIVAELPNNDTVGIFDFTEWGEGKHSGTVDVNSSNVAEKYQRMGIATEAYKMIERITGHKVANLKGNQSKFAKALWSQPNRQFGEADIMDMWLDDGHESNQFQPMKYESLHGVNEFGIPLEVLNEGK